MGRQLALLLFFILFAVILPVLIFIAGLIFFVGVEHGQSLRLLL